MRGEGRVVGWVGGGVGTYGENVGDRDAAGVNLVVETHLQQQQQHVGRVRGGEKTSRVITVITVHCESVMGLKATR